MILHNLFSLNQSLGEHFIHSSQRVLWAFFYTQGQLRRSRHAEMRKCKLGKIFVKAELYKLVEFIHWCPTASQATVAAVAIILKQGVAARDGALDHAAQLPHCARRDISAGSTHWGEAQRLELGMVLPVTGTPRGASATYAPNSRKSRARDFILAGLDNETGPKENAALYTTNSPWNRTDVSKPVFVLLNADFFHQGL